MASKYTLRPCWVLGVSALYHDSAAALVKDGRIIAAAQEERFTRRKHERRFPRKAIDACLEYAFIEPDQLAAVAYYDDPVLTLHRVFESARRYGVADRADWSQALAAYATAHSTWPRQLETQLGCLPPLVVSRHHLSHAASAFYASPFDAAAVLTIDGVGERSTTTLARGDDNGLMALGQILFPHSLGLMYSAFTHHCGFPVNDGEYKLMGLAAYGEARWASLIRDQLIDLRSDGSYRLNLDWFSHAQGGAATSALFERTFGPRRHPGAPIDSHHADVAASVQAVLEDAVIGLAKRTCDAADSRDLAMAGGVALNCVANARLLSEGVVDRLFTQPAAGDAGGAIGAALATSHLFLKKPRPSAAPLSERQSNSLLGPAWSNSEVRSYLDWLRCPYEVVSRSTKVQRVADALAKGRLVGWFCGRLEFGPRALGARSILCDPRAVEFRSRLNESVKRREPFRPFGASVLADRVGDWFSFDGPAPYMTVTARVRRDRETGQSPIPAVTHVDGTARLQTVDEQYAPQFYNLLRAFDAKTGCPVLLNTSFNVAGEPIVASPADAYRCFVKSGLDLLVLEDCFVWHDTELPAPSPAPSATMYDIEPGLVAAATKVSLAVTASPAIAETIDPDGLSVPSTNEWCLDLRIASLDRDLLLSHYADNDALQEALRNLLDAATTAQPSDWRPPTDRYALL